MTLPPMARHAPGALLALLRAHGHRAMRDVAGKVWLGLYPIITLQHRSTTLYQVSYHIQ